ncbi:unnamed protein product [Effrenium voratum]|nr:unnamed protein product [Effrenium voratum]
MPWRRHDAYELVLGVFFGTPTHGDKAQSPERCERYSPAAPSMPSAPSIGSMPSAPSMPSPTMPVQPMSMQAHIQAQIQFQAQMQAQAHQAGCRLLRLGGQPFLPLFREQAAGSPAPAPRAVLEGAKLIGSSGKAAMDLEQPDSGEPVADLVFGETRPRMRCPVSAAHEPSPFALAW